MNNSRYQPRLPRNCAVRDATLLVLLCSGAVFLVSHPSLSARAPSLLVCFCVQGSL